MFIIYRGSEPFKVVKCSTQIQQSSKKKGAVDVDISHKNKILCGIMNHYFGTKLDTVLDSVVYELKYFKEYPNHVILSVLRKNMKVSTVNGVISDIVIERIKSTKESNKPTNTASTYATAVKTGCDFGEFRTKDFLMAAKTRVVESPPQVFMPQQAFTADATNRAGQ